MSEKAIMNELTIKDLDYLIPTITEVECDNMGDTYYKYHVVWTSDKLGEVYDDYFHTRPDDVVLYNTLLEAWKFYREE